LDTSVGLAVAAFITAIARLVRTIGHTPRGAFVTASVVEGGLLAGAILQGPIPGSYFLGGMVGMTLGAIGLASIRATAHETLLREAKDELDPAGALVVLQDRTDYLGSSIREVVAPRGIAGDLFLLLAGFGIVGIGLSSSSALLLISGTLCFLPPFSQMARYVIQTNERRYIEGLMAGGVKELNSAESPGKLEA
jgi:hypothetical protein